MNHTIRCKMICHSVQPSQHSDGMSGVRMGAVYSPDTGNPDDENAVFGKYTPFGELNANMTTKTASALEVGKEYYIDITQAPSQ